MEIYPLIVGLILCVLGILMKARKIDFILMRYEGFQKAIRKKKIEVDRDRLSKFYFSLFILLGSILLIAAIIQLIIPSSSENISFWIFVVVAALGTIGILYCNLSTRYLTSDQSIE